jgi:pimeloyl-ACP methyl ester carboxylesterase
MREIGTLEPRLRLLRISIAFLLVAAGAAALAWTRPDSRELVLGDACRTPARLIDPPPGSPGRVAVVFHGLSANAGVMQPLGQALAAAGWRVYLLDLAGHGRSLEPSSYAAVDRCAVAAVDFLQSTGRLDPARAIFIGHSLGAATAVRLADRLPVAATVAISPAPLVPPRREPSNLLLLAGQFDLGPVKATARELLHVAGGTRISQEDFAQRRAVALRIVSGQAHGTMIFDPRVWKPTIGWAARAMGAPASNAAIGAAIARPRIAMLAALVLLAGLVLLVAPMETLFARAMLLKPARPAHASVPRAAVLGWRAVLGRWALASFFAASLLGLVNAVRYFHPVRLEDGDWSALAALVTGFVLLALCRAPVRHALRLEPRAFLLAALAGAATLAVFAAALRPELSEIALNPPRLWRLGVLVLFTLPYFLVEEAVLGPPAGWRRLFLFLSMRGLVWLAQLFALLVFWRSGLLLVLMVAEFGLVSIGQRLAADALRRRGAGPAAAALFDAILAAGMMALVLPLI